MDENANDDEVDKNQDTAHLSVSYQKTAEFGTASE